PPPSRGEAIALSRALGFVGIAPYTQNPFAAALFLELALPCLSICRLRRRSARATGVNEAGAGNLRGVSGGGAPPLPPMSTRRARGLGDGGPEREAERDRHQHDERDGRERRSHADRVAQEPVDGRRGRGGADRERVVERVGARAPVHGDEVRDG